MTQRPDLDQLSADQLGALATELFDRVENKERALVHSDAVIEKLTHEVAILKRHKYARRSEQLDAVQGKLLDELIDSDLAAIEAELEQVMTEEQKAARPKQKPKRTPLPPELPRTLIHHEPNNTQCQCGCQLKHIGEDISEIGCMAHARRKFYDLHEANKSELAAKALEYIGGLYEIERETKDLPPDKRREIRQTRAKPRADALHQWMLAHRQKVPDGSGTAKALDYSLKRWEALTRYLDDDAVPIDNNWVENQIRPWALGRSYAQSSIMCSCAAGHH
jgi:hypothetical protein